MISQQYSSYSPVQLAFNDLPPSKIGQHRPYAHWLWAYPARTANVQKPICTASRNRAALSAASPSADVITVHLHKRTAAARVAGEFFPRRKRLATRVKVGSVTCRAPMGGKAFSFYLTFTILALFIVSTAIGKFIRFLCNGLS